MKDNIETIKIVSMTIISFMLLSSILNNSRYIKTTNKLNDISSSIKSIEIEQKMGLKEIKVRRTSTIANDFNNPACIRNGNPKIDAIAIGYAVAKHGRYLVFNTPQDGFYALQIWLRERGDWSINKAINAFAPPIENNTSRYINNVCDALKCSPTTKIKDVNEMQLMKIIATIEGFKNY